MRLLLTVGGNAFEFTPLNDSGPYPFLSNVGTIRVAARAGSPSGLGSTESPSAAATLQNHGGRVAALIGNPLRARAELYDGDFLAFAGFVASIRYGITIDLNLES